MQEFDAWGLAMFLHHLDNNKIAISQLSELGGRDDKMEPQAIDLYITPILFMALHHATRAQLPSTYDRVWEGGGPFWMASRVGLTYQQAENELTVLRQCIEADLEKRKFAFIEPRPAQLFAAMGETWGDVLSTIPDSKRDVEDAHIALMVELHTATVFHLMRVTEYGLRVLAKKIRVLSALRHKGSIVPIEYADWQKVITALKNKLEAIGKVRLGPKRQAQLEKYSDAADHCVFLKDIWRNTISHARKPYNGTEALAVLERVRDFMLFVAREFCEKRNQSKRGVSELRPHDARSDERAPQSDKNGPGRGKSGETEEKAAG
jgi:hypothetical protein